MNTGAETGGARPQAQGCVEPADAARVSGRSVAVRTLTSDSGLQSWEE